MALEFFNVTGNTTDYRQGSCSLFSYPFTVNFWFYPTVTAVGTLAMFTLHNTTDLHRFVINVNTGTSRLNFNAFTTANAFAIAGANYTLNAWNMATAVGTSSTSRTVYINGGNSGSNTTSRVLTTPNRWIVAGSQTSLGVVTPSYQGRLSEFAIWNVALTQADISSLYTGAKATLVRPTSLKVYIPLVRDVLDLTSSTTAINGVVSDTIVSSHNRRYG